MSDSVRPRRWQPTRLPNPWDSEARIREWVAISSSNAWKWKVKVKPLSCVWLLATPRTEAYHAPLSMGFSGVLEWVAIVISGQRRSPRKQQQKGILKAWPRVCRCIDSPIWENIRQFRPERIISNQNKAPWYVGVCWIIPVSCFLDSKNVRVSISQVMNFLQEMYIWCNVGLQRW